MFDACSDDVLLPGRLDQIHDYKVVIRFADDLQAEIKVWVSPDEESKAAMDAAAKASAAETETTENA